MTADVERAEDPGTPGDPGAPVRDALAGLSGLRERPTEEHVAVFEHLHLTLTDALSAIDGV